MAPMIPPHLLQVPQVPQMPQMPQAMPACAACAYSLQATPGAGPMPSSATQVYPYHSMPGSVPIQPPAVEAPCHLTAPPQPAFAGLSQHPTPPLPSTSALSAVHPFEQLASLASATQPAVGHRPQRSMSLQNTLFIKRQIAPGNCSSHLGGRSAARPHPTSRSRPRSGQPERQASRGARRVGQDAENTRDLAPFGVGQAEVRYGRLAHVERGCTLAHAVARAGGLAQAHRPSLPQNKAGSEAAPGRREGAERCVHTQYTHYYAHTRGTRCAWGRCGAERHERVLHRHADATTRPDFWYVVWHVGSCVVRGTVCLQCVCVWRHTA